MTSFFMLWSASPAVVGTGYADSARIVIYREWRARERTLWRGSLKSAEYSD
jgi:hypothetical protein